MSPLTFKYVSDTSRILERALSAVPLPIANNFPKEVGSAESGLLYLPITVDAFELAIV
jgi:hypothetical protein